MGQQIKLNAEQVRREEWHGQNDHEAKQRPWEGKTPSREGRANKRNTLKLFSQGGHQKHGQGGCTQRGKKPKMYTE